MTSEDFIAAQLAKKGYRVVRRGHLVIALPVRGNEPLEPDARATDVRDHARQWRMAALAAERRSVHYAMRNRVLEAALLAAGLPLPETFAELSETQVAP